MMEVGTASASCCDQGWRPDRTIVLAGWDGEEYGLLGSTEYAEQFERATCMRNAVAYANIDGAAGSEFGAGGVPALDKLIVDVTKTVSDPGAGAPVYDTWQRRQRGADDRAAGQRLGLHRRSSTTSACRRWRRAIDAPERRVPLGLRRHATRLEHFLDPGYLGTGRVGEGHGVQALRLANADVLPFHYSDYAAR